jgi:hypothetical protein
MSEYLVIESQSDFASASQSAIELGLRFKEVTRVQRNQSAGWDVWGSSSLLTELVIEEISGVAFVEYVYQDPDEKLDRIEHEYLVNEPRNMFDARHSSVNEELESLIGWGSGNHDHLSEDTEDWSDGLDERDSSYWEDYLGGPDY